MSTDNDFHHKLKCTRDLCTTVHGSSIQFSLNNRSSCILQMFLSIYWHKSGWQAVISSGISVMCHLNRVHRHCYETKYHHHHPQGYHPKHHSHHCQHQLKEDKFWLCYLMTWNTTIMACWYQRQIKFIFIKSLSGKWWVLQRFYLWVQASCTQNWTWRVGKSGLKI